MNSWLMVVIDGFVKLKTSLRVEGQSPAMLRQSQGTQINCSCETSRWLTAINFTYVCVLLELLYDLLCEQ